MTNSLAERRDERWQPKFSTYFDVFLIWIYTTPFWMLTKHEVLDDYQLIFLWQASQTAQPQFYVAVFKSSRYLPLIVLSDSVTFVPYT